MLNAIGAGAFRGSLRRRGVREVIEEDFYLRPADAGGEDAEAVEVGIVVIARLEVEGCGFVVEMHDDRAVAAVGFGVVLDGPIARALIGDEDGGGSGFGENSLVGG